ncbi:MAG: sugar-binding domain-containing protein, partial [Verrucomicrobiota bacterium]
MNAILKGIFSAIALFHFALAGGNAQSLPVSLNTGWKLQSAASVPSSGSAISLPGYNPAGWHNAIVPGTVLTSLVAAGLYPEPLYGENNRPNIIPESLCRTPWWYRTTFIVPGAYSGKRIWLKFEGINHRAEVWVNGSRLINSDPDLASGPSIQGAFMRGIFDITSLATAGSTVGLAVQILPPPHPGNPIEQTMQARRVLGGEMEQKDSPTFLAAAGWDWIPALRDRNSGIWQGVSLSASGPVLVTDPYVATTALTMSGTNATSATLQFQATLKNATTIAQSGTLQYTIAGQSFSQAVTLSGSASQTVSRTITVPNPALWWPNGYGAQNRYISNPLTFTINNVPSDTQNVEFGIRKVDWVQAAGSPAIFKCVVNGVPVMIRGGNWGMDEAMKRDTAARPLEQMVRLQKEAGLNMVRNWTGETTQESFYHWCDVYGLLVWNDFWVNGPDLIQM